MTYTIKPMGPQTDLDPATNVDSATTVHLVNTHSAAVVIVRSTSADVGISSFTLPAGEMVKVEKDASDKLSASSNGGDVKVTKVAAG